MAKTRVKLNYDGFTAIRQSAGAKQAITEQAQAIAARANNAAIVENAEYTFASAINTTKGSVALASTWSSSGVKDRYSAAAAVDQALYKTLTKAVTG